MIQPFHSEILQVNNEVFGEGRRVGIILTRILMETLLHQSMAIFKSCLNLTVHWNCNPNEETSKVINLVTEMSPDRTFMQLGPSISGNPLTYPVTLSVGNTSCWCTFLGINHVDNHA